jgi:hypothetical protein
MRMAQHGVQVPEMEGPHVRLVRRGQPLSLAN